MIVICDKRNVNNFLYKTFIYIYSRTLDRKIRIKEISSILKKYHNNSRRFEKILDDFIKKEQINHLAENYSKTYRYSSCIKENNFKVHKGDIYEYSMSDEN